MKQVAVIGCGMGSPMQLTKEAYAQLQEAQYIMGSQRLLEQMAPEGENTCVAMTAEQVQQVLNTTSAEKYAILVSGDTGFFSAAGLYGNLQAQVTFYPGISSVAAFCARLQKSWADVALVSLHGRKCNIVQEIMRREWVFALTGNNLPEILEKLDRFGLGNLEVYAGENLSMPEERILHGTVAELQGYSFGAMTVILVHNPNARQATPIGMDDENFVRGKVPMTKQEIRALAISKMHLQQNAIGWDVGAGTGSVSVEMALQAWQGTVYAVECNPEGVALIRRNGMQWKCDNLEVVEGMAPEALTSLPAPDVVFLGGTKGNAEAILQVALDKNPKVRVVATAVSLESVAELSGLFRKLFSNSTAVQVQVNRAEQKGNYQLMQGQNPVWIFSGGGTAWQES